MADAEIDERFSMFSTRLQAAARREADDLPADWIDFDARAPRSTAETTGRASPTARWAPRAFDVQGRVIGRESGKRGTNAYRDRPSQPHAACRQRGRLRSAGREQRAMKALSPTDLFLNEEFIFPQCTRFCFVISAETKGLSSADATMLALIDAIAALIVQSVAPNGGGVKTAERGMTKTFHRVGQTTQTRGQGPIS